MKRNKLKAFFAVTCTLLLVGSITGCFDESLGPPVYDGPPLLQFYPGSDAVLDSSGTVAINVQLIAPTGTLSEDKQFSVTVVGDETTADSYELLTPNPVLPADSVFSEVQVEVNAGEIPPGEERTLTLQLQPSQDGEVGVAENFETFTLTIMARSAALEVRPPEELAFSGNVATYASTQDTVVVKNTTAATEATTISNVEITGDAAAQFELLNPLSEPLTLAPGDSTLFFIEIDPEMAGAFEAALSFDATNVTENEAVAQALPITGGATNDNGTFTATLQPLNAQQNISGTANFVVNTNGTVTAEVNVAGVDSNDVHPQHIHFAAECPTMAADANGDGFVDVIEGVPAYGPILVPLDSDLASVPEGDFPVANATGSYLYAQTTTYDALMASIRGADPNPDDAIVKIESYEALNLAGRTVVIHGVDPSTELPATVQSLGDKPATLTLPVACGVIEQQ